jgi:hypothetical protein
MRRLIAPPTLAFLAACETATVDLSFTCPDGTTRAGDECVADLGHGSACSPACAEGQRCTRGACLPVELPDLGGYWRGKFRIYCRQAGFASSIDARVGWDIAQDGRALLISEGPVVGQGEVRSDGVTFTFVSDGNAFGYDVTIDGIVSYGGNRIEGRMTGTHRFNREVDGQAYAVICNVAPISYVRLVRQGRAPVERPRPAVAGPWRGATNVYASCIGPSSGVILGLENATTATLTAFEGGIVTADVEMEDAHTTSGLEGRLESDGRLFFSRGSLAGETFIDEIQIGANTDPPSDTGIDLAVSWDGGRLAGEFRGLITTKEDPPALCTISAGNISFERSP